MHIRNVGSILAVLSLCATSSIVKAGSTVDDIRREVEDLRKKLSEKKTAPSPIGKVDAMLAKKFGPNAEVTTKAGKLTIGGLWQIWNYNIQDDHEDVFGRRLNTIGSGGTSETVDNNGYRIRRSELHFTIDIHENVTAKIMIDPAREITSSPFIPTNQGLFKSKAFVAPEFDDANGPGLGSTAEVANVQNGAGGTNRLLQDAYIKYHGVVPHHDFTVGQFLPPMGEEATRPSGFLDFAERSMITFLGHTRELGAQVHGFWWDGENNDLDSRVQYWVGVFNGGGNFFGIANAASQNRSDDNDEKDIAARILVRPIWKKDNWGSLELGYSGQWGTHGEAASADPINGPINGLNRNETAAIRQFAWGMYKPMGPVRGWWLRSEWGYEKDRATPTLVNVFAAGGGPNGEQSAPNPFSRQGWYFSTGYKLDESVFADRLSKGGFWNKLMQPVEFVFRYETFQNIISEDLNSPDTHTDVFNTTVWTAGVNYYVKAYNARVQVNYMVVNEEENKINQAARGFAEVNNNVFIITYQLQF